MPEIVVIILIIFGVIAITTLIFGAWLIFVIVRGLGRAVGLLARPRRHRHARHAPYSHVLPPPPLRGQARCDRPLCHADNPGGVSYCRRCGSRLNLTVVPQPRRTNGRSRHAAML